MAKGSKPQGTTDKGLKGDKQSPVADQTSNGEIMATKFIGGNKPSRHLSPMHKFDGPDCYGRSIMAGKIQRRSPTNIEFPAWLLEGPGRGDGKDKPKESKGSTL